MIQKRAAILQILQESEGHLRADEIYRRAKEIYPGIVLATVYNNLHALTDLGLIRRIPVPGGADFYDKTPTPHEHAICDVCGKLMDVNVGDLGKILRTRSGMTVLSYDLLLRVICPECKAKNKKT